MSLTVVVLLTALLLGRVLGGSWEKLGGLHLRRRRLVAGALLAQLTGTLVGGPFYAAGLVVSTGLVIFFLTHNRRVAGTGLVAAGLLANVLVVGVNGAMPVSLKAAGRAGASVQDLLQGSGARHEPAGSGTRLPWLGDVIPVPLPVRPEVVSPGDVLIAAGLGQLVTMGMLGTARSSPRPPGAGSRRDGRPARVPRVVPRPEPAPLSRPEPPPVHQPEPQHRPEPRPQPPPLPPRPTAGQWSPPARWAVRLLGGPDLPEAAT